MTKTTNNFFKEELKNNNLILAPLAGITNLPYRLFLQEEGCNFFVTEMVSAKGIFYNSKNTFPLMETNDEEHNESICGIQIFGSDAEIMATVVKDVINDTKFDFIDINMGCPVKKVVNNGDGSALLKNLKKAGEVILSVKKVSKKPVSVKTRIGFDEIKTMEIVKVLEDSGADMITVHGRLKTEMFSGDVHIDEIRKAKESVSIPLIANGDIFDEDSALEMIEGTNADGLMIGRGANYDPFLFKKIKHYLKTNEKLSFSTFDKIESAKRHFALHMKYSSAKNKVIDFRKYLYWYIKGMRNSAKIRGNINKIMEEEQVYELFDMIETGGEKKE